MSDTNEDLNTNSAVVSVQHTPGPWLAAEAISSRVGLPVVKAGANGGRLICNVNHVCDPLHGKVAGDDAVNREALANARLIAAAPDMLAALERIASGESDNAAKDASRAIAKALNEGDGTHPNQMGPWS